MSFPAMMVSFSCESMLERHSFLTVQLFDFPVNFVIELDRKEVAGLWYVIRVQIMLKQR